MKKVRISEKEEFLEAVGVYVCAAVVLRYMAGMGRYIINSVCFFILLPFSLAVYLGMTAVQFLLITSHKTRRILFAAKLCVVIALLLLSPFLGEHMARLFSFMK